MMNQHLQQAIAEIEEFIVQNINAREVRKGVFCKAGLSRLLI
jgi:putative transposase